MDDLSVLHHLAAHGTPLDVETTARLSVGLDDFKEHLDRDVLDFLSRGGSSMCFIEGQYGRGKTHLLRLIEHSAHERGFLTSRIECRTKNRPFSSMEQTYREVARSLTTPVCDESGCGVLPVIRWLVETEGRKADDIGRDVARHPYLSRDFRNLISAIVSRYSEAGPDDDLVRQLAEVSMGTVPQGCRLADVSRLNPGFPRPLGRLSKRNAANWLRSLCSLPSAMGLPGLVLLLDETEPTVSFHGIRMKSQIEYLANMRTAVDHVATGSFRGCGMFYAIVPDFMDIARDRLYALAQRIVRVERHHESTLRNRRAIWLRLDDVTNPTPDHPVFFEYLFERLVSLARKDAATVRHIKGLRKQMKWHEYAERDDAGIVRLFVKEVSGRVLQQEI